MRKIRQGVFETNSSSTHSVSISKKNSSDFMDTSLVPDEDGNIVLTGGEFGWEVCSYNDAGTKANYLAVALIEYSNIKKSPGSEMYEMFLDVIKEQTGCKEVIMGFSTDWDADDYSYIDHGHEHGILEQVCADAETLRNFLFNTKSWLMTTNDNCDTRWKIDENEKAVTYEREWEC